MKNCYISPYIYICVLIKISTKLSSSNSDSNFCHGWPIFGYESINMQLFLTTKILYIIYMEKILINLIG